MFRPVVAGLVPTSAGHRTTGHRPAAAGSNQCNHLSSACTFSAGPANPNRTGMGRLLQAGPLPAAVGAADGEARQTGRLWPAGGVPHAHRHHHVQGVSAPPEPADWPGRLQRAVARDTGLL
uniref:(northern house mosquito) hypothetical protein n=1 Tax=Culex pipiens TaxID=7175 RepID=A0A8D8FLT5_CULPI